MAPDVKKARMLIAEVLKPCLQTTSHWYGIALGPEEADSGTKLLGFCNAEEYFTIMETAGFYKNHGSSRWFQFGAFKSFLSSDEDLHPIELLERTLYKKGERMATIRIGVYGIDSADSLPKQVTQGVESPVGQS